MTAPLRIEKLRRSHEVDAFTCGQPELDRFLIRHALQEQQMNFSQIYVGLSDQTVIGYYTLIAGEVRHMDAPERVNFTSPQTLLDDFWNDVDSWRF